MWAWPHVAMDAAVLSFLSDGLSSGGVSREAIEALLRCLSRPPSLTTLRVNTLKLSREEAVLALTGLLEEQYSSLPTPPPPILPHPDLPDVLLVPNVGPRVGVAPCPRAVIVGLLCGLAVMRGASVFSPGVMGAPKDLQRGECVSVYADVAGRCKRGLAVEFDGEKVFVGNGTALLSRRELFKPADGVPVSGVAVEMTDPLYIAPSIGLKLHDKFFLQNLPSIVTGHVLDPQPGDTVLDMCAAPGGKTTHIGVLMLNMGCLVALDKTAPKVSKLRQNVTRFGLSCVHCFAHDSTRALDDSATPFQSRDAPPPPPPYLPATFDRVLLDAPCSALGQRPQLKCPLKLKDLESYPRYQRRLIAQAVGLLRPGGVLVYSTCTYNPAENEKQVAWALKTFPQLELLRQTPFLGHPGLAGHGLASESLERVQRFWPLKFATETFPHGVSCVDLSSREAQPCGSVVLPCGSVVLPCSDARVQGTARGLGGCYGAELEEEDNSIGTLELAGDTIGFFIAKFKKINT